MNGPAYPGSTALVPYWPIGRVLLPNGQTAITVPIDGEYVAPFPPPRKPYAWLLKRMEQELPGYATFLADAAPFADFEDVPTDGRPRDDLSPYWPNGHFHVMDALTLTAMLGVRRPARYLEIGSGNSTRFARRAIRRHALPTTITCVDPNPRAVVRGVADEWVARSVLDAPLEMFAALDAGDILFLDGSHLVFQGTDTTHLFLRIIPILKAGVILHVHDVFLPYEYPARCDLANWNEQHLLAMLLWARPQTEIIAPVQFMHQQGLCQEGSSFWLCL